MPTQAPVILHLLSSGGFYGAERMLLDHCLATPGRHRVLFLDGPAELIERFQAAGIECLACRGLGALLRYLGRQRSERPLLNTHNFKGQLFGWYGALLWGLPLVCTQHGFTPRSRKQRLYTWLSLQLCRTPTVRRVVCVARSIASIHRKAGVPDAKLDVIPNGLPECRALPARHATDRWRVGYVGRLSGEKGPDLFLEALVPLCLQHRHVDAVLLGEGPDRAALQARIDAAGLGVRITLPGYQRDMAHWMARLDALVISSRTEGTPMILLEAMQAGVPVVAFAVGGIPDVIEHGRSGLLATPLAASEIARHLEALMLDAGQAQALAARARQVQRERFHLPTLAQHWHRVYQGAIKEVAL